MMSSCYLTAGQRIRRTRRRMVSASLFVVLLLFFASVHAHGSHDHNNDTDVPMCGTIDFDAAQLRRITDISEKKKMIIQSRAFIPPPPADFNITIDTYFCVVTDTHGFGDVTNSTLSQQIALLNTNFANSSSVFRFELKGVKRFQQPNAYTTALNDYVNQLGISCHQGGIDALNIFIVPNIESTATSTTLGITLPYFIYGVNYVDGVYIYRNTLPGMIFPRMDHGITCVHEVGHWLGLMHPFQALDNFQNDPCDPANPQDYVSDTPLMATPSYGCPVGKDTCPNATGLDPTNNFMDYSDDYDASGKQCRVMFTPGQVARMQDVWNYYRVQNEICAIDELQFSLQFQFDNNPNEISWEIELRNGTLVHSSVSDEFGGTYSNYFAGQTITIDRCLPRKRYILNILDSGHNGIARPGFYQFSLDGTVVAKGGQDFKSAVTIVFGSATHPSNATTADDDNTNTTIIVHVDASGSCFSAANSVEVAHKGIIAMSELEIGDLVRDANGKMVRVYSFGHYHTTTTTKYLQIYAKGLPRPLEISEDHLVFVKGEAVPASTISVGDELDAAIRGHVAKVTKINVVTRSGAYAPFTTSGTIMVSGAAASNYVTLQQNSGVFMSGSFKTTISMHQLAHVFQSAHRLACLWGLIHLQSESYTEDGISVYVKWPMRVSKWLIRQNPFVLAVLLMPVFLVAVLLWSLELCLLQCSLISSIVLVVLVVTPILRWRLKCKVS